MMKLENSNISLYKEIIYDIVRGIKSKDFDIHTPLPTEVELADKYNVSRATVSKAMKELKMAGIITRYAGRGSFINPNALSSLDQYQPDTGTQV